MFVNRNAFDPFTVGEFTNEELAMPSGPYSLVLPSSKSSMTLPVPPPPRSASASVLVSAWASARAWASTAPGP